MQVNNVHQVAAGIEMMMPLMKLTGAELVEHIDTETLVSYRLRHPEGVIMTIAIAKDDDSE